MKIPIMGTTLVELEQESIDAMATKNFNDLTHAQTERLVILQEELAEAIQAVSKILRHGYTSDNYGKLKLTNRQHLEEELGHVQNSIAMLANAGELSRAEIIRHELHKAGSIKPYLHHN